MRVLLFILSFLLATIEFVFAQEALDYYPLHVTDKWIQHIDSLDGGYNPATFTQEIEGTDVILGEEYRRRSNWLIYDDNSYQTKWHLWVRSTPDGIVIGAFGETSDIDSATIYDPPLPWLPNEIVNLGHKWDFSFPPSGHFYISVESTTESVIVPAGTFSNCIKIKLTIKNESEDTTQISYYYLAKDIGEVLNSGWSEWQGNYKYELTKSTIVPVELSSFEATVSGNLVCLKWMTESEINNFGFEIERLLDSDWKKIDFVKGKGTTTVPQHYIYRDSLESAVTSAYYRLKQIDTDGTFTYSNMVVVNTNFPVTYHLSQNYPNPFNPETIIDYQLPEDCYVRLKIYNFLGQPIRVLVHESKTAGFYSILWDGKNDVGKKVPSGIYFYAIKANDFKLIKKMTLIR